MSVQVARPDVSNLVLCAHNRPLHPELFIHHRAATLRNSQMSLDARLCASGHLLILKVGAQTLTEVIADRQLPLPRGGRLFEFHLRGCRTETFELDCGVRYSVSCSVELLSPATFLRCHEELLADCSRACVAALFGGANRFSPGPLSLLLSETDHDSLLIHAYHTFPEHLAVVKTQSLFELL